MKPPPRAFRIESFVHVVFAVSLLMGGAASPLTVCIESDGSTHVEVQGTECCASPHGAEPAARAATAAQLFAGLDPACAGCTDLSFGATPTTVPPRQECASAPLQAAAPLATAIASPRSFALAARVDLDAPRRGPTIETIRATVLTC